MKPNLKGLIEDVMQSVLLKSEEFLERNIYPNV